jgi:hypothetical protein
MTSQNYGYGNSSAQRGERYMYQYPSMSRPGYYDDGNYQPGYRYQTPLKNSWEPEPWRPYQPYSTPQNQGSWGEPMYGYGGQKPPSRITDSHMMQRARVTETWNSPPPRREYDNEIGGYYQDSPSSGSSRPSGNPSGDRDTGWRRNLEKIHLEKFSGDLGEYRAWKAAFNTTVDKTSMPAEEKMLRLRAALTGKPKALINDLQAFTHEQYQEALRRIEREYGTEKREGARLLESIHKFSAIRSDDKDKIRKLKELLNRVNSAISFMKSVGRTAELGDGMLHTIVKSKIPEDELFQYHLWQKQGQKEDNMDTMQKWLEDHVETRIAVSEAIHGVTTKSDTSTGNHGNSNWNKNDNGNSNWKKNDKSGQYGNKKTRTFTTSDFEKGKCPQCSQDHKLGICEKFKTLSLNEKWKTVKQKGLCKKCLNPGHISKECFFRKEGDPYPNHFLLRKERDRPASDRKQETPMRSQSQTPVRGQTQTEKQGKKDPVTAYVGGYVSLRTIPVLLSNGPITIRTIAMLDDGSSENYLLEDLAYELKIPVREQVKKTSIVFGDKEVSYQAMKVENLMIQGVEEEEKIEIPSLWTHPSLIGNAPVVNWREASSDWDHLKDIPFPTQPKKRKVGILLGNRYPYVHMSLKEVRAKSNQEILPIARLTPLGWTCIGPARRDYHEEGNDITNSCMSLHTRPDEPEIQLNQLIPKIWELEAIGLGPPTAQEKSKTCTSLEKKAEEKVMNSLIFKDGHYEVSTPWKEDRPTLPENMRQVVRRQERMENSLKKKDPELYERCDEVFKAQVKKGYLKPLGTVEDAPKDGFYIPVFPVRDENRQTTKVRMVLDCAAKFEGVSLNDAILPGPKLIKELVDVLLRFRRYQFAITGDISEMFLQIKLAPEDRKYYRIVWGNMAYEYERTIFGDCSSPFKANKVVQEHNRKHRQEYPQAADTLENAIYVDDTLDSRCEVEELKTTRRELSESLDSAGWKIRKILSNNLEALEEIPSTDRATIINIDGMPSLPSQKTLGMMWEAELDVFSYQYAVDISKKVVSMTKRGILKIMATLFDPLGLLDPFRIRAWIISKRLG